MEAKAPGVFARFQYIPSSTGQRNVAFKPALANRFNQTINLGGLYAAMKIITPITSVLKKEILAVFLALGLI